MAALYTFATAARDGGFVSDFDQIWVAGRALIGGANPYDAVRSGYGTLGPLPFPLFYPMPAVVAGVPFGLLPLVAARAAFAAVSMGTFAYLISARGLWALAALLSAPAFQTIALVQWSGWLACAVIVPWFGWVFACKPNAGLAVAASSPSGRALAVSIGASLALVAISFALQPGWVGDWLEAIRGQTHFRPYVLRAGGVLLLLALLRWRRPEARWLAATACIPGTPGIQEALVFFAWRHSFRQLLILGLLSHGALWVAFVARQRGDFYSYADVAGWANIAFFYVPALVVILMRPNEGPVPAIVERSADRLRRVLRRG